MNSDAIECLYLEISTKTSKNIECAKFRGLCAIAVLAGLVPLCHRAFVGISWVPNFFSWVFRGSKISSREQFRKFRLLVA